MIYYPKRELQRRVWEAILEFGISEIGVRGLRAGGLGCRVYRVLGGFSGQQRAFPPEQRERQASCRANSSYITKGL